MEESYMFNGIAPNTSIETPSSMADADWRPIHVLNRIKLSWTPRLLTDRFKISPVTVRRQLKASESVEANHIRWERQLPEVREKMMEDGDIEPPIPCKYVKVNTDVFNKLRGYQYRNGKLVPTKEDKRVETVRYYDADQPKDGFVPSEVKYDKSRTDYENEFYNMVGVPEEDRYFPVVDEDRDDDVIATMQYEHKTGGAIGFVKKSVAKLTRRKNYGTCLSTISPYRS